MESEDQKEELYWPTDEEMNVPVRRIITENSVGEQEFPYEQAAGWLYRGNARDTSNVQKALMLMLPRVGASLIVPMEETFKVTLLMCDENYEPKRHMDELKFDYTAYTATFKDLKKTIHGSSVRSVTAHNGYVNLQPSRFNDEELMLTTWQENPEDISVYHVVSSDHKYRTKYCILNGFRRIQYADFKYHHATDEECKTVLDYLAPKLIADVTVIEKPLQNQDPQNGEPAGTEVKYYCVVDRESVNFFANQFAATPVRRCKLWLEAEAESVDKMLIFHQQEMLRIVTHQIQIEIPQIVKINHDILRIVRQMGPLAKSCYKNHENVLLRYREELEIKRLEEEKFEEKKRQIELQSQKNRLPYEFSHGRGGGFGRPPDRYRGPGEQSDETSESNDAVSSLRQTKTTLASYNESLKQAESTYMTVEEISLPWIVAEEEIKNMLEQGVVPETDVLSGGLDPNNTDHFMKCMQEIEHQINQQNYDVALSRLQGTKKIFSECPLPEMAEILSYGDLELMKKLYYHSFA